MTPTEAYDAAVALLGPNAAAWSPDGHRCIVGRWTRLHPESPQGSWHRRWTLERWGDASTWEDALLCARTKMYEEEAARANALRMAKEA